MRPKRGMQSRDTVQDRFEVKSEVHRMRLLLMMLDGGSNGGALSRRVFVLPRYNNTFVCQA